MDTDAATKAYFDHLKAYIENVKTHYATLLDGWIQPIVRLFTTTSTVQTHITVDVHVDRYVNFCYVYLYWIMDLDTILQYFQVDLINNVGMVEFWNLYPQRTYIVELYVEDKSKTSKVARRERYPNGKGLVVIT